jgi:hypothetical protein
MRVVKLFPVMAFLVAGPAARADSVWEITGNTSSFAGTYGYLDFVFDPGPNTVAFATASIEDFSSDGTLDLSAAALETGGDVSGNLPGTVTLDNGTQQNYYSPGFTYGTYLDFIVDLAWTQPGTPPDSGSTFSVYLYDSNLNPLLSYSGSLNGEALDLEITPDGSVVVDNSPEETIVPEPGTLLLLILPALALLKRWKIARRR